jgi:hypothetical protein
MDTAAQPRMGNRRLAGAYLGGTGAAGALIAGAVTVFLSAAAFVAFNGFSFPGGGDESSVAISASHTLTGAPEIAAASLAQGADAVARRPTAISGAGAAGARGSTVPGGGPAGDGPGSAGDNPSGESTSSGISSPSGGPASGAVQSLDQTTSGVGLPPLSPTTKPQTDAVNNTLNNVATAIGQPHLGDQVGNTTDDLLGGG